MKPITRSDELWASVAAAEIARELRVKRGSPYIAGLARHLLDRLRTRGESKADAVYYVRSGLNLNSY